MFGSDLRLTGTFSWPHFHCNRAFVGINGRKEYGDPEIVVFTLGVGKFSTGLYELPVPGVEGILSVFDGREPSTAVEGHMKFAVDSGRRGQAFNPAALLYDLHPRALFLVHKPIAGTVGRRV